MTRLCVAIFVVDVSQAHRDALRAAELGADLVEYRVDQFDPTGTELIAASPLPAIVTCRPTSEGGQSEQPDLERFQILQTQADAGAALVDVELATLQGNPGFTPAAGRWIASAHDFTGRPDRLYNILADLNSSVADVAKVVWTARSVRDNLEAFEILRQAHKPTIALCMGEAGLISRVLAPKFGAYLTFAALDTSSGTAPGQIGVADMKRLYRFDSIGRDTCVYGVVGCPVGHSLSPAVHNAAFDHVGFNGIYLPLLVQPGYESFKAFMETFTSFAPLDLAGLSITIPHKENALRYLIEKGATIDPLALQIGALNTIVIDRKQDHCTFTGFSTDYSAILDSITDALAIQRAQLAGCRVAVIGAGGTGRTAVAALAACGATVVVYNRTFDRAAELAADFNGKTGKVVAARLEKLCDSCCQIYLNTTSIGMSPKIDETPMPGFAFTDQHLVFDAVYNPVQTRLLREASAAGAKTIAGTEMFLRQAAGQFTAWTHQPAPLEVMRQVLMDRLSNP